MYESRSDLVPMGVGEPSPGGAKFEEGLKQGRAQPDIILES
jgi:hypothetical protein